MTSALPDVGVVYGIILGDVLVVGALHFRVIDWAASGLEMSGRPLLIEGMGVNPTSVTDPSWRVENTPENHSYRFINLQDHTAWRVIIHGEGGFGVTISGHVSYGRGSFCQRLEPGTYWLTWDNTLSMLDPRVGEAPRPKLESAVFSVPLEDALAIELAAASG